MGYGQPITSEAPVMTFRISAECKECKVGEMIATGTGRTGLFTYYDHKCSECGFFAVYRESYPVFEHRLVGGE